jgi:membrane protein implicated in regulation of membrane protease activity
VDPWIVWLIAALALGIIEVVSGGTLVLGMVAIGSLAGAATAAATDSTVLPWVVFAGTSAAMLIFVRPVARKNLRTPIGKRSGTAALVGATARVTEQVTASDGRIKLSGEIWSARSFDGDATFAEGESVQVLEIDGATALVA